MNIFQDLELSKSGPSSEQRRHPRAFVTIAVTLETGNLIIRGNECRNISAGGMFISLSPPLPEGTCGTVTLTKKCGDKRVSFSSDFVVLRVIQDQTRSGSGIEFTKMSDTDKEMLTFIVDFHLSLMIKERLNLSEDKLDDYCFKIAETREELEQAFRIVHDAYVQEGYMNAEPHGLRLNIFNALPTATTFIATKKSRVIMATTLYPDSLLGIPLDKLYESETGTLRAQGRFIAEVGAFAAHPDYRSNNASIALHLQKLVFAYSTDNLHLDDVVITINPKHRLYYKHVLLFEEFGAEKYYREVNDNPAIALRMNMNTIKEVFHATYGDQPLNKNLYTFFTGNKSSFISYPPPEKPLTIWNRNLIHYFFEEKTDILSRCEKKVVNIINSLYP